MLNKVSSIEKSMMRYFIETYAFNGSGEMKASIDTILQPWVEAKSEYLFNLFGKELILSRDITYVRSEDEIIGEMSRILFNRESSSYSFIKNMQALTLPGGAFKNQSEVFDLISLPYLASNIYSGSNFSLTFPDGTKYRINTGSKIMKTLGYIAKKFHFEDNFEEFRLVHSRILNQKKLTGKLCLSIHPLDYITMSTNDYNWNSCMDWTDSGEYRRGTVEMMNSPMVVVAYLNGSIPMMINNEPWSNKKWRQLFIINENLITGVRPYPYDNSNLEKEVLNWLRQLAKDNLNWDYYSGIVPYSPEESFSYHFKNYKIFYYTNTMYNDLHHGDRFCIISPSLPENCYRLNYSGPEECMSCGNTEYNYYDSEYDLLCENCDSSVVCSCCGERYEKEDMMLVDDLWYCQDCAYNEISYCDISGRPHHPDNLIPLYLAYNPDTIFKNIFINVDYDTINSNNCIVEVICNHKRLYYCLADKIPAEWIDTFGFNDYEDFLEEYQENNDTFMFKTFDFS